MAIHIHHQTRFYLHDIQFQPLLLKANSNNSRLVISISSLFLDVFLGWIDYQQSVLLTAEKHINRLYVDAAGIYYYSLPFPITVRVLSTLLKTHPKIN